MTITDFKRGPATSAGMRSAYSASELWTRDWRLWCVLAKNRASFINECQISTPGLSHLVHTSDVVGDTSKCLPGLSVGPPRSMSAAGCLLMSALTHRNWWAPVCRRNSRWSTIPRATVRRAKQWLLEECTTAAADAAGEDREAEEQTNYQRNVSALTTHSRTHNTYLTPVWTSFSCRLINDYQKIEVLVLRIEYHKKTILTSLIPIQSHLHCLAKKHHLCTK